MKKTNSNLILSALFAALICAGCFIQIPLPGGIPIVIQDMAAFLSGLLLGPLYGSLAVLLFIILGCAGIPVFTGKAGINVIIAGPTGGFIIGYSFAALAAGIITSIFLSPKKEHSVFKQYAVIIIATLIATIIAFTLGTIGFAHITKKTIAQSIPLVVFPFIPGNIIKLFAATLITKKFRPIIQNYKENF